MLLPDGFRFSQWKTRRDWTDEATGAIRDFLSAYSKDGKWSPKPYLAALVKHRDEPGIDAIAAREKLNAKYLGILRQALTGTEPSFPLDRLRARFKKGDVDGLAAEITTWQESLWRVNKIGSYGGGKLTQQEAATPPFVESQTLKIQPKPVPGKSDVTLRLATLDASAGGDIVWRQPRFTAAKQPPVLLRDYSQIAARYEIDLKGVFADTAAYLAAADGSGPADGLDPVLLKRWKDLLALGPAVKPSTELDPATMVPAVALEPLDVPEPANPKFPAIKGWRSKLGELPVAAANTSDKAEHIPGLANPHKVVVHPSPDRFVAAAWTSPVAGRVRIEAQINHVHPGCGNGILWFIEVRRGDRSAFPMEGVTGAGRDESPEPRIDAGGGRRRARRRRSARRQPRLRSDGSESDADGAEGQSVGSGPGRGSRGQHSRRARAVALRDGIDQAQPQPRGRRVQAAARLAARQVASVARSQARGAGAGAARRRAARQGQDARPHPLRQPGLGRQRLHPRARHREVAEAQGPLWSRRGALQRVGRPGRAGWDCGRAPAARRAVP